MAATPADVKSELARVRTAVSKVVPAKTASNLLIGTWNLRAFGDLTESWKAGPTDSPKRDWRAVALIAEIAKRFDVLAVQEVKRNTTALLFLLQRLGPTWRVIASDATAGDPGNDERLAFVYDSARVQPSGLVGEVVLPAAIDDPVKQFARTPYAASFVRGKTEFILTTVHVLWGSRTARLPEIVAFAKWMREWADRDESWNENLLVLGDFNLDRLGNPLFEAFVSTGLWPPPELNEVPRTIFHDEKDKNYYDQIAWFTATDGGNVLTMEYTLRAGTFDFVPHVLAGMTKTEVSWRISDHLPLWVEFRIG
jgi:endonuclease/exonuclease/phosphatase family metal-dependent hydrolase